MSAEPIARQRGSVVKGFVLVVFLHVAYVILALIVGNVAQGLSPVGLELPLLFSVLFIGITQGIYVAPLALRARRRGERRTVNGVMMAAAVTFLLNATCFALVYTERIRIGG